MNLIKIHFVPATVTGLRALAAASLLISACSGPGPEAPTAESSAAAPADSASRSTLTAFAGARLIVGDGEVIENAVFTVNDGRIDLVGPMAAVTVPDGATRVDLSGMTVMPAIIDAHTHLSTTREALLVDLRRRAALGVGAALSLGTDPEGAPLDMRGEVIPGAARYRSAGRGITAPEPGRSDIPHWVTTPEEARQAVRDEAARDVDIIKIWVDDRSGQYAKLTPEIYAAAIDEAHRQGLKAAAHIFTLEDAKGVLRAGIDVFAHGVRDRDVDDEFVELVRARPNVVLIPNLPSRGVPMDLGWLDGVLAADEIEQLRANNTEQPEAQEFFGIQARNLARLSAAGMRIAFGTDGNTFWAPHVEMEDMVAAGMAPGEVLVAATQHAAEVLGLDDAGTLQAGKRADFIVLTANPLDDITNTRRIGDVYLGGDRVDRSL
jgi:imidazolonepropionase-like amidohydrolase